jgi:hypothetical protein
VLTSRCYMLDEQPKPSQTSRNTNPPLTGTSRIGPTTAVTAIPHGAPNKLAPLTRAGVAAGSAILIAILWPSDIALASVKRGTGAVIHGIHGTAAHAQVLSLYNPAIIDCVDNAITKKAVVPPAPSAVPPAAAPAAASAVAAPAVAPAVAVPMAAVAVPMAAPAAVPLAVTVLAVAVLAVAAPAVAVPVVAGVLAVQAMVRAVPLV